MPSKNIAKIHKLRQQPEETRLQTLQVLLIIIGLALVIISLAILLPLQLYLT